MSPGESVLGFEESCGRVGGLVTAVLLEALGENFPAQAWARGRRSVMHGSSLLGDLGSVGCSEK